MELDPKLARTVIEAAIDAGNPVMVSGAPGIGKSDVVRQIADARGWGVIDLRLATMDPVDLRGLPAVVGDKAVFRQLGELPDAARDGEHGILFLDELAQAPMATQNAAFSLVLDRRIGDYHLPEGWHVVAAGNRTEDRAGAQRLNSALANRFVHVDMAVSVDAWCQWALNSGVAAELVAFVRFRPELLHSFSPDRKVNATPRSWAMAARYVGKGLAPDVETAALAGTVGEGPASEFLAFLRIWRSLPSPDAVFLDPTGTAVPKDGATLYAICGALARKVTPASIDAFCQYIGRMSPEYGVLAMRDAIARDKSLLKTRAVIEWLSKNSNVYM